MKKTLNKIFLIIGFVGTMMCTSYTIYTNINKFTSSLKNVNGESDIKDEIDNDDDDDDDDDEIDEE